jgi:hypothetical protein
MMLTIAILLVFTGAILRIWLVASLKARYENIYASVGHPMVFARGMSFMLRLWPHFQLLRVRDRALAVLLAIVFFFAAATIVLFVVEQLF